MSNIPSTENARFVEFSAHDRSPSMAHLESYAQKKNLTWNFENFPAFDESLLQGVSGALVDPALSEALLDARAVLPTLVQAVRCCDSFLHQDGHWYPRLLSYSSLRDLIVSQVPKLDIFHPAYILGNNEIAKMTASLATDLGFAKVVFVTKQPSSQHAAIPRLQRAFMGVEFSQIAIEEVIAQKTQASIFFNCENLEEDPELLTDISYFNFMKQGGVVLDCVFASNISILSEEAGRANLQVLTAADIFLQRDLAFLAGCGLSHSIDVKDYTQSWHEFLKSHPLSSYKKRHS